MPGPARTDIDSDWTKPIAGGAPTHRYALVDEDDARPPPDVDAKRLGTETGGTTGSSSPPPPPAQLASANCTASAPTASKLSLAFLEGIVTSDSTPSAVRRVTLTTRDTPIAHG